ncbi:MAG TPA: hypothetical protein VMQ76_11350 [Terracidiphilus sp.]|jgi:hypothetical protein|nr:hypothetical protein [Terracidiphilus sp.]
MNIQFETSQIGQAEAQGLVSLLSSLFPTATAGLVPNGLTSQPPAPKNEEESIFGTPIRITPASSVPVQAEPAAPASTPAPAQPEQPAFEPPKRTRRTKAQIEADEVAAKQASGVAPASPALYSSTSTQAAPADPTPASAAPSAGVSGTTQSATAPTSTVLAPEVRTIGTGPTPLRVLAPTENERADELRALLNGYIAKHSMEEAIGQLKTFGCNRVTEALALKPAMLSALAEALRG